jgi:hypothetical protein
LRPQTRSYSLEGGDVLFDCCFKTQQGGQQ